MREQTASTLQLEDLLNNPARFGLPTFEEFCLNPDRYFAKETDILDCVDESGHILRKSNLIKGQVYELEGYRCDSLEKVQDLATEMGIKLSELDMKPDLQKDLAGKYLIHIKFTRKRKDHAEKSILSL